MIRGRLRLLFTSLIGTGVGWLFLMNYVKQGRTPLYYLSHRPSFVAVIVLGAAGIGLLLDLAAAFSLRPFLAVLREVTAARPVPQERIQTAALVALNFPHRSARLLAFASVALILIQKLVDTDFTLLAKLHDPRLAPGIVHSALQDFSLAMLLALMLYTFSGRLLRRGVALLGLTEMPEGSQIPIASRLVMVVAVQALLFTSLSISLPANLPPGRLLWLYIPFGLLCGLVGYLLVAEPVRDLTALAGRLRILSGGGRPNLFNRLAVTDNTEIGELVGAINRLQNRVEGEFRTISRDLEAARSVQQGMLPRDCQPPAGWQFAGRLVPAHEVGGDFYDIIPLDGSRMALAVGDAVGKGLPAALLMASAVNLLRSQAPLHESPASLLSAMNRWLCNSLPSRSFITMTVAIVEMDRRQVTVAAAGHLPPLLDGREAEVVPSFPLGVDPEARYEDRTYTLASAAPILLCTDGLYEVAGSGGEMLTPEKVIEQMGSVRDARLVLERLFNHFAPDLSSGSVADDITALVLVPPAEQLLQIPSCHGAEAEAALAAAGFARQYGPAGRADDIATAVGEACLNAIVHGNRLRAELPVGVRLRSGSGWFEAAVSDCGELFEPPAARPDLDDQMGGDGPISGWGWPLMLTCADRVTVEPLASGKQVLLRFESEASNHG